ncbi:MAG: SMP-30/gluconolactonase/LRE family protein [Bryobacter sp.]|nr:SMP-30/gluconolactonase/LRE family protein [Bryobacter sp.]
MTRRCILGSAALAAAAFAQSATGKVAQFQYKSAKHYPGTVRDVWVYVPGVAAPAGGYALMVFQDGANFVRENGPFKTASVFDRLIAAGAMPPTVGVFVQPGVLPPLDAASQMGRYNRSYEYDGLGDRYALFLLEEILPEVEKMAPLTKDPNLRGLGGSSSGAICAFTAAWNRPDQFRRVLSFIGSYVNLRGGNQYPDLIRHTEPKPLRVFLQDGTNDLNIYSGSWYLANLSMKSALEYSGYDVKWVEGTEGHNSVHAAKIFAESLEWLWADWKQPIGASKGSGKAERHFVTEILDPAHDWEEMSAGHGFTEGPAVDAAGNVYFTDVRNDRIHKIEHATGKVSVWKDASGGANGIMFGADGKLYACQSKKKQMVAFRADGSEEVLAEGVTSNDLVVDVRGNLWWTDPANKKIWHLNLATKAKRTVVENLLEFPNGIILSPDQALLMAVDARGRWVWSWQVQPDGSLAHGQPFYHLETWDMNSQSGGDGMTMDTDGHLYVATRLGIQICDQAGRVVAILNNPQNLQPSNCVFAGPEMNYLYTTNRAKVFRRKLRRKGVRPNQLMKPPQPRL